MALSRGSRIKSPNDFKEILRSGKSVRGTFLFLKYTIHPSGKPRMGVAISQRVAKTSVERNRIKRIIFAQIEQTIKSMPVGYNGIIVVQTRPIQDKLLIDDVERVLYKFQSK